MFGEKGLNTKVGEEVVTAMLQSMHKISEPEHCYRACSKDTKVAAEGTTALLQSMHEIHGPARGYELLAPKRKHRVLPVDKAAMMQCKH